MAHDLDAAVQKEHIRIEKIKRDDKRDRIPYFYMVLRVNLHVAFMNNPGII